MGNAKFSVNGQAFDSVPRGVDVADGALLTLALENPSSDVRKVKFEVVGKTKNVAALLPVFSPVSGVAATPASSVTAQITTLGTGRGHTYKIRCTVNDGRDAVGRLVDEYVQERIVCVRSAAGLRKPLFAERGEYDVEYGWQGAMEEVVDNGDSVVRTARMIGDEWNPSYLGHNLLAWYRCDVGVVMASATEVASWDDVRGPTGYGPQLTPPTAAHRASQLVAGGPLVLRGEDSPLAYDGLDAACPAAWIGATELTIVLVASPDGTEGDHWGDPDWGVAHLLTVSNAPGTDGVALLANTESYEASGVYLFQGLGEGVPQVLIAASGVTGKTTRQGAFPGNVSATAMGALAASARIRLGFDQAGGGVFYPANMSVYEVMVFRGRLTDADMRAVEDYVSRQGYGGVTEIRPGVDSKGDSLSAAQGGSPNEYPVRRLARDLGTIGWHLQAVSGYTLAAIRSLGRGKRQLTIRERRLRHLFSLWACSNDIATATLADSAAANALAASLFVDVRAAIDENLDAGYAGGIVSTVLPRTDITSHRETARTALNALILTIDSLYGGRVLSVDLSDDVGLATIDGTAGYWHADDIHLLDPGYQAVADLWAPKVTTLLALLAA